MDWPSFVLVNHLIATEDDATLLEGDLEESVQEVPVAQGQHAATTP